jgi:hypothetical protein
MGLRMHEWHVAVMFVQIVMQALISIQHVLIAALHMQGSQQKIRTGHECWRRSRATAYGRLKLQC